MTNIQESQGNPGLSEGHSHVIDVVLLPSLASPESLAGKDIIVVDVLRATTTITTALQNGCRGVLPQPSVQAAKEKFSVMESDPATQGLSIIGGERGGKIVEGFHQGNSPIEYSSGIIQDKWLILATTNGTVAMEHCRLASRVLIGCMANLTAVATEVLNSPQATVLCSGTDRHITSEDVLFAGAFVDRLIQLRQEKGLPADQLTDSALIALNHWRNIKSSFDSQQKTLADYFRNARGGINLVRLGHNDDIEFAANIDSLPVVPELDLERWVVQLPG